MKAKTDPNSRSRATRAGILRAAREIALERGWSSVTIRAIADELGYASPIIYEHFRNKEEAISAAAGLGFDELATALAIVSEAPGTEARLLALTDAYIAFAVQSPELYRVMHGMEGATTAPEAIAAGASRVCTLVLGELVQWARNAEVRLDDPLAATETLWCVCHGVATLALAGRLQANSARQARDAVRALLAGWRAMSL